MIWYMIDGFNGYEINKEGIVRSMKMMNKNPGHHIKLYDDDCYVMTNNFNKRVRISRKELLDIVFNSGNPLKPRPENSVYMGGRNKHFYFDEGIHPQTPEQKKCQMDFSKFVIKDDDII